MKIEEQVHLDLLEKVAAEIKTGREFMGSKWQNCEAETIALQTIAACALNYKNHGEAISWQGSGTLARHGYNNPRGVQILLDDGSLELSEYEGKLSPPQDTVRRNTNPMVFTLNTSLLYYAAGRLL